MKVKVTLYIAGSTHDEIIYVDRFQDAAAVALARNPTAKVVNRRILMN